MANRSLGMQTSVGAPAQAIGFWTWEIDEPAFLFGDITNDGRLGDSNAVPASAPDDISLAPGFAIGSLAPDETLTVRFFISRTAIGGLLHADPS